MRFRLEAPRLLPKKLQKITIIQVFTRNFAGRSMGKTAGDRPFGPFEHQRAGYNARIVTGRARQLDMDVTTPRFAHGGRASQA